MKSYTKALRANIWKLYVLHACSGSIVILPIIVLFWQENGLSLREVFILQALYSICVLFLEIPSGYLSDRWGRRNTLIAGSGAYFCGFLFYAFSNSFIDFLTAELFIAVGNSFYSGTADALTYDTLLELKKEKEFRRISGNQFFAYFGSEAIASLLGGLLATVSMQHYGNFQLPVWATIIPFSCAFFVALTMHEPKRHKLQETRHFHMIWNICKKSLIHNVPLRSIIILGSVISAMSYALFWFLQPYQSSIGLSLLWFGIVNAIITGVGAFAARQAHILTKHFDDRILLLVVSALSVFSFLMLGWIASVWGLIFFLLSRIAWSIKAPLIRDIINRMTTSDIRGTVLSINAFGFRTLFAIIGPIVGYAAEVFTISEAIFLTGVAGGIIITATFIMMRPIWKELPK